LAKSDKKSSFETCRGNQILCITPKKREKPHLNLFLLQKTDVRDIII
jgi:hypothetical protein